MLSAPLAVVASAWLAVTCPLSSEPSARSPVDGREAPAAASVADRLTVHDGCETTFLARDPGRHVVLVVQLPGLLERSSRGQLPYREEVEVGGSDVVVRLEQGADLDHWCNDVLERPPRIDAVWVGVSGSVSIAVSRRRRPGVATVRLRSLVLERQDRPAERLSLPDLEIITNALGVPGGG